MNVWLMENRSQAGEWFGGALRAERAALTLIPNLTQLGREFQQATPDLILVAESHARRDAALAMVDEAGYVLSGIFRPQAKSNLLYHWRVRAGSQKPPLALLRKLGESW